MRASVSVVEPGTAGTTIFTVRDGYGSCAWLGSDQSIELAATAQPSNPANPDIHSSRLLSLSLVGVIVPGHRRCVNFGFGVLGSVFSYETFSRERIRIK